MAAKKSPKKVSKKKTVKKAVRRTSQVETSRLWLMFPAKHITRPVVWELAKKYDVVTNVRQASVTGEIGIVCLELQGIRSEIKASIKWLERLGVSVEPVEINVIES